MWQLDHKEGWVLKNWWFWTVVLGKTLESPLDCKEINPIHPKGNQSWIFIGRTDAEAETPTFWPPDVKIFPSIFPVAGKDWRKEEKGMTEDEMVGWHHWLNGHEFEQVLGNGQGQGSLACFSPVLFSSVAQLCPTLCDPMDCSTPGLPVHHQLPEFTQTHVHWIIDAIQPSHPLLSPSPAFSLSQHHGLFPVSWLFISGGQSIGASASASVPPMNIQN